MPAPCFILNYSGSKYRESKQIKDLKIDYKNYDTVIEPFGGSFGFSRYLFYDLGHTHLNFIVCDADDALIDFYNYLKEKITKNEHEEFFKLYTLEAEKLCLKCKYEKITGKGLILDAKKVKEYFKTYTNVDPFMAYIVKKNHFNIAVGLRRPAFKLNAGFTEIFKKTTFLKKKFEELPDEMLYNKKNLVYLDPPYLSTDNSTYDTQFNLNAIFEKIENLLKNGEILFIHQYNFLINRVFSFADSITYKKIYSGSRKKTEHTCFYRINTNNEITK